MNIHTNVLQPKFQLIPDELKGVPRWVTSLKKVPYCAGSIKGKASSANPHTWSNFDLTQIAYEEGGRDGVGFVFNGDGIVGIDLDHCVVNGQPTETAIAILKQAGCRYVEYSQSGTGLHAFGYCSGLKFNKVKGEYLGVRTEIFNSNFFIVVTGNIYQNGGLPQFTDLNSICDGIRIGRTRSPYSLTEETEVTKAIASVS